MRKVILNIKGTSSRPGEDAEIIENITEGTIYEKGGSTYIVYDETELTGMNGETTTVRVSGNKVRMLRFGAEKELRARLDFEEGREYEEKYMTPAGVMDVTIRTTMVDVGESTITIEYEMDIMGIRGILNRIEIGIAGGKNE